MSTTREDLQEIRKNIRESEIGQKLSEVERWSRFRTNEPTSEWIELLGPTAVVLTHQEYFVDFILNWSTTLDQNDRETLILAGSIHDLGEAVNGDIAAPSKTQEDEDDEHQQAIIALKEIGFKTQLESTLEEAYWSVVAGDNQSLHYLFKAFERAEYLDTAIHLFQELSNGKQMNKGSLMMAKILAFDLPKIIDFAIKLPHIIGAYLFKHSQLISEMFFFTKPAVNEDFLKEFTDAQSKWISFSQQRD